MTTDQLRRGNLLHLIGDEYPIVSVHEIFKDEIRFKQGVFTSAVRCPIILFKEVQLTPEVLIRLGFKPIGKSKDYRKGKVILHTRKRGFVVNVRIPIIKSVDQLQNYYYFSEGKELEIDKNIFQELR